MQFESVKDAVMQFESTNFIYFFLSKFSGIFALYQLCDTCYILISSVSTVFS